MKMIFVEWMENIYDIVRYRAFDPLHRKFQGIKWFIQRGRRGWADCDTWNLNIYLGQIIGESVEHLRVHTHGHPANMTEKQWGNVLLQISASFASMGKSEAIEEEILGDFSEADFEEQKRRCKKLMEWQRKHFRKLERAGTKLGKHLPDLWD